MDQMVSASHTHYIHAYKWCNENKTNIDLFPAQAYLPPSHSVLRMVLAAILARKQTGRQRGGCSFRFGTRSYGMPRAAIIQTIPILHGVPTNTRFL